MVPIKVVRVQSACAALPAWPATTWPVYLPQWRLRRSRQTGGGQGKVGGLFEFRQVATHPALWGVGGDWWPTCEALTGGLEGSTVTFGGWSPHWLSLGEFAAVHSGERNVCGEVLSTSGGCVLASNCHTNMSYDRAPGASLVCGW